jgi:predicted metal-dependent phosphoesterase TrpH
LTFPFKGIEVWHPDHSSSQITLYEELAAQAGLLMTGGSDCHGEKRSKLSIGGIKVAVEVAESLIAYKKAHL